MNNLIESAAFFVLCKCKKHGRINKGKSVTLEFGSKEDGFEVIDREIKAGDLCNEEAVFLKHQIQSSPLPEKKNEVSFLAEMKVELANEMISQIGKTLEEEEWFGHTCEKQEFMQ